MLLVLKHFKNNCNEAEMESCSLMGIEFLFFKMKSSEDLFHNDGNILNTTGLYIPLRMVKMVHFVICFLPQ